MQLAAPPGSEPAARAFWIGILGFEEIEKPAALQARGGCWFRGFDIEIHVGVEEDFQAATKAHPGLLVQDLCRWAERLAGAGHDVGWDEDFPGMRRFFAADPFGNRLEFLEPQPADD